MLQFLRRHQRYFFVVITVVIIISFSFFGTYSTLEPPGMGDQVVFTAVDGQKIRRSDLESMALFLGSDGVDKLVHGGQWGPNFLNDGVIAQDFLNSGLAVPLVEAYQGALVEDLQPRLEKEKSFAFYVHPGAPFISAETIWGYFVPTLSESLGKLRASNSATDPVAIQARVQLYLAERNFPARALQRVLTYQEQQFNWLTPDPNLTRLDLSIFGYHTLEDWFGPRFVRLVAQFIINSAKIAERKGYKVSREEATADLIRLADQGYEKVKTLPNLGVTSSQQYMRAQLRRMGLDEVRAVSIWQQVLLFRRLFDGVGNAIFVDVLPFEQFNRYALERADGNLYELAPSLWLANFRALQQFETYLTAVGKGRDKPVLSVPTQFVSADELLKTYPELVQKRYLLEVAETSVKTLQGQVRVKDMWDWQMSDANWQRLTQEFPELGTSLAKTSDERFKALEALPETSRSRVDSFARAAIVAAHPEWIDKALEHAEPEQLAVGIRLKGGKLPIAGVDKPEQLMVLLDKAPIGQPEIAPELQRFSADGQSYYRIRVLDRTKTWEPLSFGEATADGTLDAMVKGILEPYYEKVRNSNPEAFRKKEGDWRPFAEVQDSVAELYFKDLLAAIERDYQQSALKESKATPLNRNAAAAYRLHSYVASIQDKIRNDPAHDEQWLANPSTTLESLDKLPPAQPVAEQFKLRKKAETISRKDERPSGDKELVLALPVGGFSTVMATPKGDLWFFQVTGKGVGEFAQASSDQLAEAHTRLSSDAERLLMLQLLKEMAAKNAISVVAVDRKNASEPNNAQ